MEKTQVIIVGAGPAGLTLGHCLAQYQISSVVLEKEQGITTDPRGVYLTGDSVRVFSNNGLAKAMTEIGHPIESMNFHQTSFTNKPFFTLDETLDTHNQVVPNAIWQVQPKLEEAIRCQISQSKWCTLRTGCKVTRQLSDEPPTIEYEDESGVSRQLQGQWLVGADGKTGIVRKHFLEPTAGIKQEEGVYKYSGTWVAANLRINSPTPETHPQFPLWEAGYTPDEVFKLFWPRGWHFCSPPGKATATGRFGPLEDRLWRHEFRQEDWDDSMNAEELLWEHLTPMITRDCGTKATRAVQYPRDCIEVIRCRPFTFTHKVVNRWFHKRTILIGDAAHVFPPFAGQGIGSGVRDAHQLAWRLAMLLNSACPSQSLNDAILGTWAVERRKSVDDAALLSLLNGRLCNEEQSVWRLLFLRMMNLLITVPFIRMLTDVGAKKEREGMTTVAGGFLLQGFNGGARMAQIVVQSQERSNVMSDCLFQPRQGVLTLLVIGASKHDDFKREAEVAIETMNIDPSVLSKDSVILFSPTRIGKGEGPTDVFWPMPREEIDGPYNRGYDKEAFVSRLGHSTRFAIIRPDFYVFACAKDVDELVKILASLKDRSA